MRYSMNDILADDPLNLLQVVKKFSGQKTETERLIGAFEEVNEFFADHKRTPKRSKEDIIEFALACRLQAIKKDTDKFAAIGKYDKHKLLAEQNIETILAEDKLGLLDEGDSSIFDLKHVPVKSSKPDYIANRKPCKDFKRFETKFEQCKLELKSGYRKMIKFKKESSINQGEFFVLNGVTLYVAAIGNKQKSNSTGNPRLRCIFANGTECDMLLRSLASGLYKNGKRIVAKETGYIYVVRSLSEHSQIAPLRNLYKIGYSTTPVEKRLRNTEKSSTYLYAAVELVARFTCYNINPKKLEFLLHKFFSSCCLDVQINGGMPREWFIVPLPVIRQAIDLLLDGTVANYRYDREAEKIRQR